MQKEVLESLSRWLEEDDLDDIDLGLPTFDELFPAEVVEHKQKKTAEERKSKRKKLPWFRKKV